MVTHDVEEAIVLADRIMVMRPHPGRVYEEIVCDLPRPRDRQSAAFDFVKRRVLASLDRSLDRAATVDDGETRAAPARRCGGDAEVICVVHARPCAGHLRLYTLALLQTRMAPTSRATTMLKQPTHGSAMRSFQVCQIRRATLQLAEQPTPSRSGTEVLLKVIAAGVCHSDLHLSDGYFDLGGGKRLSLADRGMKLPVTLGHENVGEVVAFGPQARGVRIGDRRLVDPWMGCGECGVCRRGDEQLCTKPGSIGVFRHGGYSDYLMVPHPRYLFDIGDLPPERGRAARLFGRSPPTAR